MGAFEKNTVTMTGPHVKIIPHFDVDKREQLYIFRLYLRIKQTMIRDLK